MYVQFMSADDRNMLGDEEDAVSNPTFAQIEQAILALDGKDRTTVILSPSAQSDEHMCIAGQWDQRCMVYATVDNLEFFSLIDLTQSSDLITLLVGGQSGFYERIKCVPITWARDAAKVYFEDGVRAPAFEWVIDK
jgi:hypothetical protein